MLAHHPQVAKRWPEHSPHIKSLPERVRRKRPRGAKRGFAERFSKQAAIGFEQFPRPGSRKSLSGDLRQAVASAEKRAPSHSPSSPQPSPQSLPQSGTPRCPGACVRGDKRSRCPLPTVKTPFSRWKIARREAIADQRGVFSDGSGPATGCRSNAAWAAGADERATLKPDRRAKPRTVGTTDQFKGVQAKLHRVDFFPGMSCSAQRGIPGALPGSFSSLRTTLQCSCRAKRLRFQIRGHSLRSGVLHGKAIKVQNMRVLATQNPRWKEADMAGGS